MPQERRREADDDHRAENGTKARIPGQGGPLELVKKLSSFHFDYYTSEHNNVIIVLHNIINNKQICLIIIILQFCSAILW